MKITLRGLSIKAVLALTAGLALAACAANGPNNAPPTTPPAERPEGQSEFLTPSQQNGNFGGAPSRGEGDTAAGAAPNAGPPTNTQTPTAPPAAERLIEEADIYKIVGDHIYVLNRYRGLQIIDIANLDRPRVIGRAPIFGWPKEMYVRDNRAYVIVSDYYTFWRDPAALVDDVYGFYGSQLRIIDIADKTNPRVIGGINLAGDLTDSRIVGNVMYLVSQRYGYWYRYDSTDTVDKTTVLSVSIADPQNVRIVDSQDFPRNGWEHHINVTQNTIYLASSGYNGNTWPNSYTTKIRYIDIRDPAGRITLRGEATVPGMVRDRWSFDEHQGVLRVASGTAWGNGDVFLTTLDVTNPDRITRLGQHTMHINENLTAARFDGFRGYLVTYRNVDPLWVFDLSEPARPRVMGELHMSGWLDFMVPMGDRIVALGHDDIQRPNGGRDIRLAVSLIKVEQQSEPTLISRVQLDGLWGWVPSERDDFAKVFKVIGEQNLVVFPYHGWSQEQYRYVGGVQLIDFFRDRLVRRGLIQDAGWVERGVPHGENTVLTVASEVFQVMDIANRDTPRVRGRLELARNVQDFALVGDHTVQLSGDWWRGDTSLVITPKADPDTATPVASMHVPAPYGRLFMNQGPNGRMAYLSSMKENYDTNGNFVNRRTQVQVIDLTNPAAPRLRGRVELPEEVWLGYRYWYWGSGDEVAQSGSTLAVHRYQQNYYYGGDCLGCGAPQTVDRSHKVFVIDLANPDEPRLASTVVINDMDWSWGLRAVGSDLFLSSYRSMQVDENWYQRYSMRRINIANPSSPVVSPEINIPGMFVNASEDGRYVYTLENFWHRTDNTTRTLFHTLALIGDRAYLRSSVGLEGYVNNVVVKGGAGYTSTSYGEQVPAANGRGTTWRQVSKLVTLDLSDPRNTRIAGQATLPYDYGYLQAVEGGRAFLGSGAGIFSYLVNDIRRPTYEDFFRTQGWAQNIVVDGSKAFVPSGYYGVQVLNLGGGAPR